MIDDPAGGAENDALRRRHPARQIDDHPGEFAAQLVKQHVDRAGIDDQRLGDRRLGGEDAQRVGYLDRGAVDEQRVDARGLLQRLAQSAAGVGVELQRDRAEMQIEVEQHGAFLVLLGQQPGAGDRRRGGADAAAAADKGDDLAEPAARAAAGRAAALFERRWPAPRG